jgi:hypothetical protein
MGGVGKTVLAQYLAQEYNRKAPGRVLWVLAAERPVGDVQGEMARALGFEFQPNDSPHARASALRAALQANPRLVIFDDVRPGFDLTLCLPPSPPCAALITSRQHELPGVPGHAVHSLDVMTPEQARALLDGTPGVAEVLASERTAADELCELCYYHPLALDLAARRLLFWVNQLRKPTKDFNATLHDRLAAESPLAALSANFELSYAVLSEADRARWRRLAVIAPSGFSPDAAAHLWGETEAQAVAALNGLFNASLLLPAKTPGRLRLHDLLRNYAARKLREANEAEATHQAHAVWLLGLFEKNYTTHPDTAPIITPELDNLRELTKWAQSRQDGQLLALLATKPRNWLYNVFRINEEWETWLTEAMRLGVEDKWLKANVLKAIGDVQQFRKDMDAALTSYE